MDGLDFLEFRGNRTDAVGDLITRLWNVFAFNAEKKIVLTFNTLGGRDSLRIHEIMKKFMKSVVNHSNQRH